MTTHIEWTDETWNPVTGCSKEGKMEHKRVRGCLADLCVDVLAEVRCPQLSAKQNRAIAAHVTATLHKLMRMEEEAQECERVAALGMTGLDWQSTRTTHNKPQYTSLLQEP